MAVYHVYNSMNCSGKGENDSSSIYVFLLKNMTWFNRWLDDLLKSSAEVSVGLQIINRSADRFQYVSMD